jgi:uncharacterized protein YeaO (DUF488 family)
MIKIKRIYDKPEKEVGFRILVDRLWPRGLRKEELKIDLWLKEVAPSTELRKWFAHDPARWKEFCKRYKEEFTKDARKKKVLIELVGMAGRGNLTLVYSASDEEHNNAVALKELIESFEGGV